MASEFTSFDGPVPLFPLPNVVLLPYMVLPLHIFEPRYSQMVSEAAEGHGIIGMVLTEAGRPPNDAGDPEVRRIGCVGRIADLAPLPENRFNLKLIGLQRFEIIEEVDGKPYRRAKVRWLRDRNGDATSANAQAARGRIFGMLAQLARARGEPGPTEAALQTDLPFAGVISALAVEARLPPEELQGLLELSDVYARARRVERAVSKKLTMRRRLEFWKGFTPEDPSWN